MVHSTCVFILHNVEPCTIDADEHIDLLCQRAAGFFVYAVVTVNFLRHRFKCLTDQLAMILESPESTDHEGKVELKVYRSLHSLYMSIFQEAFCKNDVEDDATVCSVLSTVIFVVNPLSPSAVATLLGFKCNCRGGKRGLTVVLPEE